MQKAENNMFLMPVFSFICLTLQPDLSLRQKSRHLEEVKPGKKTEEEFAIMPGEGEQT